MGTEDKLTDDVILANVLEALDVSANKFAKKLEYKSSATIYHVLNGVNGISTEMANKAVDVYPQLNFLYLTRGQEPIILDRGTSVGQANFFNTKGPTYNDVPQTLKDIKDLLSEVLDHLKQDRL